MCPFMAFQCRTTICKGPPWRTKRSKELNMVGIYKSQEPCVFPILWSDYLTLCYRYSGGKAYRFLLKSDVSLFRLSKVHNYKKAWMFQRLMSNYSCQMTNNINYDQRYRKNNQRLMVCRQPIIHHYFVLCQITCFLVNKEI